MMQTLNKDVYTTAKGNSVAHIMNVMNKGLRDYIPDIMMSFLDDSITKGCSYSDKPWNKIVRRHW